MSIEELIQQTQKLTAEVQALTRAVMAMKQTPLIPAPIPVPTQPTHTVPGLPPRPGSGLNGVNIDRVLMPSATAGKGPTEAEKAAQAARQAALQKCTEASRAMAMASMQRIVTPQPILQNFLDDPNFIWPGYAIIEAARAPSKPRPI